MEKYQKIVRKNAEYNCFLDRVSLNLKMYSRSLTFDPRFLWLLGEIFRRRNTLVLLILICLGRLVERETFI